MFFYLVVAEWTYTTKFLGHHLIGHGMLTVKFSIGAWYRKLGFIYGIVALLCHILLSMLVRLTMCLRAREMCSRILQGHHLCSV